MTQPIIQEKARKGDLVCAMYEKRSYDADGKPDGWVASYRLAEVMSATRTGRVKTIRDCAVTRVLIRWMEVLAASFGSIPSAHTPATKR